MYLLPTKGRVVIERDETPNTTKGGIILPDKVKEKPKQGTVIAIRSDDSEEFGLEKGQKVLFIGGMMGNEVEVDGKNLLIVPAKDILATVH